MNVRIQGQAVNRKQQYNKKILFKIMKYRLEKTAIKFFCLKSVPRKQHNLAKLSCATGFKVNVGRPGAMRDISTFLTLPVLWCLVKDCSINLN